MAIEITPPKRDRPRTDRRQAGTGALWRLTGWGGAAALALAAFAVTTQTEIGGKRLQLALAVPAAPVQTVADLPRRLPEKDTESRALEAQVRALATDRDRLATRLATLEHQLDDITGSIQRQASEPAPAPSPAPIVRAPEPATQTAGTAPKPAAPVTTSAATSPLPPIINPLVMPPGSERAGSWPSTVELRQTAPPLTETEEIVPLPPSRLAALPATHAPSQAPAPRLEYGIELGTAPDIGSLRTRWAAVKANYGPLLTGLQPVAVHDRPASGGKYRLIAGPLVNFAAAKETCARFTAAGGSCRPARFDPNNIVQH